MIFVDLRKMERRTYVLDLQEKRDITEKVEGDLGDASEKGEPRLPVKRVPSERGHPAHRSDSVGDCPVMSDRIKGSHEPKSWLPHNMK